MEEIKESSIDENKDKECSILLCNSISDSICGNAKVQGRVTGPTRRSAKGGWTELQDKMLELAVQKFGAKNWKKIAACVPDRTDVQCLHRWQKVLNPNLVKGSWSKEEDDLILELVGKHGNKKWSEIAKHLPGRIGKQCRERWYNHLNPDIKRTAWSKEEELTLIESHKIYGNRWAEIAKFLPGRTENSIKNHWNCSVTKRLGLFEASGALYSFDEKTKICNSELLNQRFEQEKDLECKGSSNTLDLFPVHPSGIDRNAYLNNYSRASENMEDLDLGCSSTELIQVNDSTTPCTSLMIGTDDTQNTASPETPPPTLNLAMSNTCHSPDFILRSAAKTFKNTPSIIRKRRLLTDCDGFSSPKQNKW